MSIDNQSVAAPDTGTRWFVDAAGKLIGGFANGAAPPEGAIEVNLPPQFGGAIWNGVEWHLPASVPVLTRSAFCVALTKDHLPPLPPIFTAAEALAALEAFPPKFTAALAGKPLEYQAAAIEAWRETKTVARNAPLFLDLLAFYAAQAGLTGAQAEALGDSIFAGAE
jgi:hypothetical protein